MAITAELIEGDKGIFDVEADGELIYSKYRTGRFPRQGELAKALRELRSGQR